MAQESQSQSVCVCGASFQERRECCYFPTEKVDDFDFGEFFTVWNNYLEHDAEIDIPRHLALLKKSFNFFGSLDINSLSLEKCRELSTLARLCVSFLYRLREKYTSGQFGFTFVLAEYTYCHFNRFLENRITILTTPIGFPPITPLSSENW